MLKKIFIVLVSALMAFNQSNAQMLNSKGEKVVKRIEVCYETEDRFFYSVDFRYDSSLRLKIVEKNSRNGGRTIFEKVGGEIKRTDYKENGTLEDVRYRLELNEKGFIKRVITDNLEYDGSISREVCYYDYSADGDKLSSRCTDYFKVHKNGREEFSYRCEEFFGWEDGNMYTSEKRPILVERDRARDVWWQGIVYYDKPYFNDTNIDLFEFYREFSNLFNFECVTEWVNGKSERLVESYRSKNATIYYCYDSGNEDCLGNIIKMYVSEYGREKYIFRIYYL